MAFSIKILQKLLNEKSFCSIINLYNKIIIKESDTNWVIKIPEKVLSKSAQE